MKQLTLFFAIALLFTACRKENDKTDLYELPWNTKYITYRNIQNMCGSHSSGFQVYYRDSLLMEDCIQFGGVSIADSLLISESSLLFFKSSGNGSVVLHTKDGGLSWSSINTGPPPLLKFHKVTPELIYCITYNQKDLYFTGIGKSALSLYKTGLVAGTHNITDSGTDITHLDSTTIPINDSVTFVIQFR